MIFIEHTTDFKLFSSIGVGAMQGYGYQIRKNGGDAARLVRFYKVTSFTIHDVILVDSPAFRSSMDTCDKGEVSNMLIRGGDE